MSSSIENPLVLASTLWKGDPSKAAVSDSEGGGEEVGEGVDLL